MNIGFLLFQDLTQLDLTGPLQILSRMPGARTYIVSKNPSPVESDCKLRLVPDSTLGSCPQLDLLCVPGGVGIAQAVEDREIISFVKRQCSQAKYVTAVCTGAFLLGAAGLLRGRKATTHWAYVDLLPLVGAIYEKARVVQDGNVITAGGVTSGIDFGLAVVAAIAGADVAKSIQLSLEYDPAPPFDSGHPDRASPEVRAKLDGRYSQTRLLYRDALQKLGLNT